jgi:hypothetical protein
VRKLPKRPRTFGRTKAKPYPQKRKKQQVFLNEQYIQVFDELLDGLVSWLIEHNEHGMYARVRIQEQA